MTDSRDGELPRGHEPDSPDMLDGEHDYAMWDAAYVLPRP